MWKHRQQEKRLFLGCFTNVIRHLEESLDGAWHTSGVECFSLLHLESIRRQHISLFCIHMLLSPHIAIHKGIYVTSSWQVYLTLLRDMGDFVSISEVSCG